MRAFRFRRDIRSGSDKNRDYGTKGLGTKESADRDRGGKGKGQAKVSGAIDSAESSATGSATSGAIVECVPNFSEGTNAGRVKAIVAAMRVDGVHLLDWSMDADHNRSVVTIAGE